MDEISGTPERPENVASGNQPNENIEPKTPETTPTPRKRRVKTAKKATEEAGEEVGKEVTNMAMLCHFLGIFGFLGPLVVWLLTKDKHKFIDEQGKEALNFQLMVLMCLVILCVSVVLIPLIPVLLIVNIIFVVVAAVKVSDGKPWRYPIAIRFLK